MEPSELGRFSGSPLASLGGERASPAPFLLECSITVVKFLSYILRFGTNLANIDSICQENGI